MQMIKFDKNAIHVDCIVKMGFTRRAYQDLLKIRSDPEPYVDALSRMTRFIITADNINKNLFWLHTSFGEFLCGVNQKNGDGFSVISFKETTLYSQNIALKKGVIFSLEKGVTAEVLLTDYNLCYKYVTGKKYDFNAFDCGNARSSTSIILDGINLKVRENSGRQKPFEDATEPYVEVDYEDLYLKDILKQAEQYSILSSELDEKKTHEMGQLSYREFFATDYDRIDRIAYAFVVDSIDKSVFKNGVQIEIEGRHHERINGEIVEVDTTDKENLTVVILFNKQVSIDMFPSFGLIYLSFSTVNKDVQLDANTKIVEGNAKAKYMKNVLGASRTTGFDNKDLSNVRAKLALKKYPPNVSQIKAIEKGINSRDIFLVMGPPGTGKTTVILEWVKYFVEVEHKRVLVSSQNNKAVDNVLVRLIDEKDIDVIRIGSEAKLQQEVIPYMFENKLVALNQKIETSTSESINKLETAIEGWSQFRKGFYIFNKLLMDIDTQENELRESIQNQLVPLKQRQIQLYADYKEQKNRSLELNKKLEKCTAAIDRYLKQNIIIKKIFEFQYKRNLSLKSQLETDIMSTEMSLDVIRSNYNKCGSIYESAKAFLKERFVPEIRRIKKRTQREMMQFEASAPSVPNIANLFEGLMFTPEYLKSAVILKLYLHKIDVEIDRAKLILQTTESWKADITGKQNYSLNEIILETVDLVGATCIGVSSQKRFANLQFDVTIIDEAGQIQIHNALVPMSVSNKLIMLGDYKQIPPTVDQELVDLCELNGIDPELLKKSLFEKLFSELPTENKMMLDTQYRMPGEIADTISEWFYNGEYKSPDFKRNLPGLLPGISRKPFVIIDTSGKRDRFEQRTEEGGTYNNFEVSICREILSYIIQHDVEISMSEIGIISAYADQVSRIKKEISPLISFEEANAMVATLDSFQGQERDLIIYSFTKSSRRHPDKRRIGFLNELRRLNVAMSRCKKTLIMVGDMTFLSGCQYQDIDDYGTPIYEFSEKEFSDFIQKLITDVVGGRGEYLDYARFRKRAET